MGVYFFILTEKNSSNIFSISQPILHGLSFLKHIFKTKKYSTVLLSNLCFTNCRMQQAPMLWGGCLFEEGD